MENIINNFVTVKLNPDLDGCANLIWVLSDGKFTEELEESINKYALGNFGAATVLTKIALRDNYTKASEIESLVGWPLWSHNQKKAEMIWDRFKNEVN